MSNKDPLHERTPRRGLMLVISSPSGAGKTSLSRRLVADHEDLELSVSCTTRGPRPGEQHGREYYFVDRPGFDAKIAEGEFLEWADVHDNRYGSPRGPVLEALEGGRDVLFDIDWQGAAQITQNAREAVVKVFILPPAMAALRRRLMARAQDSDAVIERRLAEIADPDAGHLDAVLVGIERADALAEHLADAVAAVRARGDVGADAMMPRVEADRVI